MEKLLDRLQQDYPQLVFTAGESFHWSPQTRQIYYTSGHPDRGSWAILHETAHALLGHANYFLDFELLQMEVDAWEHAKKIAKTYGIIIDEDHIQDCLDSYRDWLYKRSICPTCNNKSIQRDNELQYQCFNCRSTWSVAASRFCRPYRQSKIKNESPIAFAVDDSLTKVS